MQRKSKVIAPASLIIDEEQQEHCSSYKTRRHYRTISWMVLTVLCSCTVISVLSFFRTRDPRHRMCSSFSSVGFGQSRRNQRPDGHVFGLFVEVSCPPHSVGSTSPMATDTADRVRGQLAARWRRRRSRALVETLHFTRAVPIARVVRRGCQGDHNVKRDQTKE